MHQSNSNPTGGTACCNYRKRHTRSDKSATSRGDFGDIQRGTRNMNGGLRRYRGALFSIAALAVVAVARGPVHAAASATPLLVERKGDDLTKPVLVDWVAGGHHLRTSLSRHL
eukprot:156462_1